ncbi:MAG: hypothetical protein LIP09_09680 [Bacteroidales bacterium]|nr:hypothetical protein [Bacteroidales bacterium]
MATNSTAVMPLMGEAKITKPFGQEPHGPQMIVAVDSSNAYLYSSENNGEVAKVEPSLINPNNKAITIQYAREDGTTLMVTYDNVHTTQIEGDKPLKGASIGNAVSNDFSGKSQVGISVELIDKDGQSHKMDPNAYISDIVINQGAKFDDLKILDQNNKNVLTEYVDNDTTLEQIMGLEPPKETLGEAQAADLNQEETIDNAPTLNDPNDPTKQKKDETLTGLQDLFTNMGENQSSDLFQNILAAIFQFMVAMKILDANKSKEENEQVVQEVQNGKELELQMDEGHSAHISVDKSNGKAYLTYDLGKGQKVVELTSAVHVDNLTEIQQDPTLSHKERIEQTEGCVRQIDAVAAAQAIAQNQNIELEANREQSQGLSR